jgi:hypothetical protein
MSIPVLAAAIGFTVVGGGIGLNWYNLIVDTWLVGIIPVMLIRSSEARSGAGTGALWPR